MNVWAIADLHLSLSVPDKSMEAFGPLWEGYQERIAANWKRCVHADDLVLIPGDICWAMRPKEAVLDLEWIDALPGTKVLLKGNHDYWWGSKKQVLSILPPSLHIVQNDVFTFEDFAIGGARLWDTEEYNFDAWIHFQDNPKARLKSEEEREKERRDREKLFSRELERLRLSLEQLPKNAKRRIAMTHYPPIGPDMNPSKASAILEEFGIEICVFGHLHNVKKEEPHFGVARSVRYHLVSADTIHFTPLQIV